VRVPRTEPNQLGQVLILVGMIALLFFLFAVNVVGAEWARFTDPCQSDNMLVRLFIASRMICP